MQLTIYVDVETTDGSVALESDVVYCVSNAMHECTLSYYDPCLARELSINLYNISVEISE